MFQYFYDDNNIRLDWATIARPRTNGHVSVFCTGKLWVGQDRMLQFLGGLVNYEVHYDLS
jgi:hypothetical protein